jgi:hypothetical protein
MSPICGAMGAIAARLTEDDAALWGAVINDLRKVRRDKHQIPKHEYSNKERHEGRDGDGMLYMQG